jgi:hypothetical protein
MSLKKVRSEFKLRLKFIRKYFGKWNNHGNCGNFGK